MKKVRFKELFEFTPKSKLKASEGDSNGEFPFYTSSPILSKSIDKHQFEGEHLIFATGGAASVHYNRDKFSVSSHCSVAKPQIQKQLFNPKYIFYYLSSNIHLLESGFRGAGLRNLSNQYISNLIIPLPDFGIQNRIVAVVDKVNGIIAQRKKVIDLLSNLALNDLFLHDFGDVHLNLKKWPVVNLETLCESIIDCPHSTPKYSDTLTNFLCLRSSDISDDGFLDITDTKFVTKPEYDKRIKRHVPSSGEVIYCREGARFGKAALIKEGIKSCLGQRIMLFSANPKKSTNEFIWALLNSQGVYHQAERKAGGAGSPHVNIKDIRKFKVFNPPKKLQEQYSNKVTKITKIREVMLDELKTYEELLTGVTDQAFAKNTLKTNLPAFSFDDQVVDYIEKEYVKNEYVNQSEQLKQLIQIYFKDSSFTFEEFNQLVKESGVEIAYEYELPEKRKGLKDFIFEALESDTDANPVFLNQVFEVDTNRDTDKNKDESKIAFQINK